MVFNGILIGIQLMQNENEEEGKGVDEKPECSNVPPAGEKEKKLTGNERSGRE
jgi:hypothetical protein